MRFTGLEIGSHVEPKLLANAMPRSNRRVTLREGELSGISAGLTEASISTDAEYNTEDMTIVPDMMKKRKLALFKGDKATIFSTNHRSSPIFATTLLITRAPRIRKERLLKMFMISRVEVLAMPISSPKQAESVPNIGMDNAVQ